MIIMTISIVDGKKIPKKRGRKPRKKNIKVQEKAPRKKRGRKPKGGKIVGKLDIPKQQNEKIMPNIILHLKCSTCDIKEKSNILVFDDDDDTKNNIESFNLSGKIQNIAYNNFILSYPKANNEQNEISKYIENDPKDFKEIWNKLRLLKYKLHHNDVMDKKSDCFWCTYGFSNPPIFIPKNCRQGIIEVYGCFCSPECAVAFLKEEKIDSTTMWERYALLNNIYGKIYDYSKNIKPSPNPYYTLEKYYGSLSIQEYRKLLRNDRLLLVVDKPLTKIMPELYEENNETPMIYTDILSNYKANTQKKKQYRLQRKAKKTSKKSILREKFNIST